MFLLLTVVSHMRTGCNSNISPGHVKALVMFMFPLVRILVMSKYYDVFIVTWN